MTRKTPNRMTIGATRSRRARRAGRGTWRSGGEARAPLTGSQTIGSDRSASAAPVADRSPARARSREAGPGPGGALLRRVADRLVGRALGLGASVLQLGLTVPGVL